MKTIKRNWLKKQIELGKVEAKCNYHMTDDYAFDNAYGFGKTDWMKARISRPTWKEVELYNGNKKTIVDNHDFIDGQMNFKDYDFEGKPGRAWGNENGTITLYVHSNLSYELRMAA